MLWKHYEIQVITLIHKEGGNTSGCTGGVIVYNLPKGVSLSSCLAGS